MNKEQGRGLNGQPLVGSENAELVNYLNWNAHMHNVHYNLLVVTKGQREAKTIC